ncbi:MAG: hypothetical protein AAFU03_05280 [Bacteroidota bacterium]
MTSTTSTASIEKEPGLANYIDTLRDQLNIATANYNQYAKAASKAQREYTLAQSHCDDLTNYHDRITSTYNLVIELDDYIVALKSHAEKICTNVTKSCEALGILSKWLKCLCEDVEALKDMIRTLLDDIDAIGSDTLSGDNATLINCIRQLEEETKTAITEYEKAVTAMIDLLRCVLELQFLVCDVEDDSEDSEVVVLLGLVTDLEKLRQVLCCEYCAGIDPNTKPCESDEASNGNEETEMLNCCGTPQKVRSCECDMVKPALCNGGFASDFYTQNIDAAKTAACELADYKKCVWTFYEKKKSSAQAKRDAVQKALDAAENAKALCN